MPDSNDQILQKMESFEQIYSRVVVSLIEISATVNVLLDKVLEDASEEERTEFADKVNTIQMQSAQFIKDELDNVSGQTQD